MKEEDTIELYKLYRNESYESFKLHRLALQHYLTLVIAILGATIAGIVHTSDLPAGELTLLAGPTAGVAICWLGIKMSNRYYQGALERISISLKLEQSIYSKSRGLPSGTTIFPNDKEILPERWSHDAKPFDTSEDFINHRMKSGVNRVGQITFIVLILINLALATAIILRSH